MKTRLIWCLLGVNIALVATLLVPHFRSNTAVAQISRPSDYLMVPGEIGGVDRGVIYLLDTSNGMMSAVAFDDSSGRIEVMPPTDLIRVFEEGGVPRRRR